MSILKIRNKLHYYRLKCGISQQQIAYLSNVHRVTISRIEADKTKAPHIKTQKKLAKALDVPLYKLFPPKKFLSYKSSQKNNPLFP